MLSNPVWPSLVWSLFESFKRMFIEHFLERANALGKGEESCGSDLKTSICNKLPSCSVNFFLNVKVLIGFILLMGKEST